MIQVEWDKIHLDKNHLFCQITEHFPSALCHSISEICCHVLRNELSFERNFVWQEQLSCVLCALRAINQFRRNRSSRLIQPWADLGVRTNKYFRNIRQTSTILPSSPDTQNFSFCYKMIKVPGGNIFQEFLHRYHCMSLMKYLINWKPGLVILKFLAVIPHTIGSWRFFSNRFHSFHCFLEGQVPLVP